MRTYGQYAVHADAIGVQLHPAASTRFKRVFERVSKGPADWIVLSPTPENAREIEWFMDRYPLEPVKVGDAHRLDRLAREYDRAVAMVNQILAPGYAPPAARLAEPARDYQLVPNAMLTVTGGLLVGDELGLGKTVTGIVAMVEPGALPALVIAPVQVTPQWKRMIARFAPSLTTHILGRVEPYSRGKAQDLALRLERGQPIPDVIVASYSKLSGWAEWIHEFIRVRTVIYDEAHEFRTGEGTLKFDAATFLAKHTTRRMGLTGTPIYNHGSEIWNVMQAVAPHALGSREEFLREWCGDGGNVNDPIALGDYLRERGLFIRRTKAEVGRELPPLTIVEQFCDADPQVIASLKSDGRAIELARFVISGTRTSFQSAGQFDMIMRQTTGIAKAPFVAAFVDMLLENDKPVLLYGWHHEVYGIWRELLAKHKPAFYTGAESLTQKEEAARRFRSGETRLIVMSLRAGQGIDGLQDAGCTDVVFGELDWSPAVHEQAIGRIRRDGNDEPVTAWFMVADEGADPNIAEHLGVKRGQLEGIRDPRGAVVTGQTDPDAMKRLARQFLEKVAR